MGRKSIPLTLIQDSRDRRICFIKRRIGAVKKLMQLSMLSGCKVDLKIYLEEDASLLEYRSEELLSDLSTKPLDSYLNLYDKDLSEFSEAELSLTRPSNAERYEKSKKS